MLYRLILVPSILWVFLFLRCLVVYSHIFFDSLLSSILLTCFRIVFNVSNDVGSYWCGNCLGLIRRELLTGLAAKFSFCYSLKPFFLFLNPYILIIRTGSQLIRIIYDLLYCYFCIFENLKRLKIAVAKFSINNEPFFLVTEKYVSCSQIFQQG